jgi:hypothetical protein
VPDVALMIRWVAARGEKSRFVAVHKTKRRIALRNHSSATGKSTPHETLTSSRIPRFEPDQPGIEGWKERRRKNMNRSIPKCCTHLIVKGLLQRRHGGPQTPVHSIGQVHLGHSLHERRIGDHTNDQLSQALVNFRCRRIKLGLN